ncbi:hypothetical protein CHS0354_041993 [Potamilus streckersoni]|uniref:Uncharacterized protein n=1 Tax=Potamilus streckersoni TaxID=2493646 RepID=A0AAE0T9Y3_9BIVA|nr:hypothetical protein CHS0354_041993 [Potamilus streckersoni]
MHCKKNTLFISALIRIQTGLQLYALWQHQFLPLNESGFGRFQHIDEMLDYLRSQRNNRSTADRFGIEEFCPCKSYQPQDAKIAKFTINTNVNETEDLPTENPSQAGFRAVSVSNVWDNRTAPSRKEMVRLDFAMKRTRENYSTRVIRAGYGFKFCASKRLPAEVRIKFSTTWKENPSETNVDVLLYNVITLFDGIRG